ncbi:hypothetical protein KQJ29_34115, partial [Enterococcus sp. S181_ASV_20]|nr:hypothetical protein [Enterococcus sp. S181_ASV_20]
AQDGIGHPLWSVAVGDVYKRQTLGNSHQPLSNPFEFSNAHLLSSEAHSLFYLHNNTFVN